MVSPSGVNQAFTIFNFSLSVKVPAVYLAALSIAVSIFDFLA
jgi:hypothetical protein